VDHDLKQQFPADTYAGDKGYDESENHSHLELRGLHSAIHLKNTHLRQQGVWLT